MTDKHVYQPGPDTKLDSRGRVMRLCLVCGKSGRGRQSHLPGPTVVKAPRPNVVAPSTVERAQLTRVVERIVEVKVEQPDWRLQAAYHAIVHAEEVRDLDAGLEHALKIAARELDYVLHRRPKQAPAIAAPQPLVPRVHHSAPLASTAGLPHFRDDNLRDLARAAVAQGFDPKVDGAGHLRLTGPDGRVFVLSTTANGSAARGYKNARAAARRAGVVIS